MALNEKQRQFLRGLAHSRKPVVIVGQAGVSDTVVAEIDAALNHHELIKVRVNASDREARRAMTEDIAQRTGAELVQSIGHVASFYRSSERARITLP
ncbi:ribosome assembly RNA-binding protein YhbY [Ectothiorhodospiraceae bacterium 2226]|nr:ribosome assembly RNA-binding protein YhbY [Ectothiorhodospiraceae bacterium 2226]